MSWTKALCIQGNILERKCKEMIRKRKEKEITEEQKLTEHNKKAQYTL